MPLLRVEPIIPVSSKDPFDDPEWLFEFKYDGYRGLCYIEHGRGNFISRNANDLKPGPSGSVRSRRIHPR
jgi:ATP-dependent DNA ligase